MKRTAWMAICVLLAAAGCRTTYDLGGAAAARGEDSLVIARPGQYSILGTRSFRDYIEIVYEEKEVTDSGKLRVRVGVRNRGGQHWYDRKGTAFNLAATAKFYATSDLASAPLYTTNRRQFLLSLGETADLVFDCPVVGARAYQVVFTDQIR